MVTSQCGWVARQGFYKSEAVCHWLRQCFVLVACHLRAEMCLADSCSSRSIVAQNTLTNITDMNLLTSKTGTALRAGSALARVDLFLLPKKTIHTNPVKRGLCRSAVDDKWSSARFHLQSIIDPDHPVIHRPDPEWLHKSGVTFETS